MFAKWTATLTRWWPPGSIPNRDTSSECERIVKGCQFMAEGSENARTTPCGERPLLTMGLEVTYSGSS